MKTSKFSKVFIVLIMAAVFGAIAVFFCSNKPYAVIAEEVTEEMQTEYARIERCPQGVFRQPSKDGQCSA